MNTYQQKWLEVLQHAQVPGWKITAFNNDIQIEMPSVTDLKLIRDNLPMTLASISLDIEQPKARLKFLVHNGHENFEYILNPNEVNLNEE